MSNTPLNLRSCSKILHPFSGENCNKAAWMILRAALVPGVTLYFPLFFISSLFSRKWILKNVIFTTLFNTARGTLFLALMSSLWIRFLCIFYKITGKHTKFSYFLGASLGVMISSLFEKQARRKELALYCFNQALELVGRSAVNRGLLPPVRNAVPLLFAFSTSILYYFQRCWPECLSSNTKTLMALFFPQSFDQSSRIEARMWRVWNDLWESLQKKLNNSQNMKKSERHSTNDQESVCTDHGSKGCISSGLFGFVRSFLLGFAIRLVLAILSSLIKRKKPQIEWKAVFQTATSIGSLTFLSRSIPCLLRRVFGEHPVNYLLAGFAAGLSVWSRSSEISFHLASKAVESLFLSAVEKKWIKPLVGGDILLLSLSGGLVCYGAMCEPHNLRPSYFQFMNRASGGYGAKVFMASLPLVKSFFIPNRPMFDEWLEKNLPMLKKSSGY